MTSWQRKTKVKGKNEFYSISTLLKKQNKINEAFEIMLNNLTLEELIALKLEIASKACKKAMYGIQIWRSLKYVAEDAVLKYSISATRTKAESWRFLGLNHHTLREAKQRYNPYSYFEEPEE